MKTTNFFTTIKNYFTDTLGYHNMFARIEQTPDGFTLTNKSGTENFGSYSRRRDAVRGAVRRGLTLI